MHSNVYCMSLFFLREKRIPFFILRYLYQQKERCAKLHNIVLMLGWKMVLREWYGTPLQYSCLENPMDGGAWKAAVHGVAEGRTQLSDFTFTFHFPTLEKEMATHSSVLAWRIPGTAGPGGLPSMGSHRVRHDWSDLAAAAAKVLNGKGIRAPLVVQMVKHLPAVRETRTGLGRSPGEGNHPIPVLLPGKFNGLRSLVGYSPWGRKE